jgi:hypothetical protein
LVNRKKRKKTLLFCHPMRLLLGILALSQHAQVRYTRRSSNMDWWHLSAWQVTELSLIAAGGHGWGSDDRSTGETDRSDVSDGLRIIPAEHAAETLVDHVLSDSYVRT